MTIGVARGARGTSQAPLNLQKQKNKSNMELQEMPVKRHSLGMSVEETYNLVNTVIIMMNFSRGGHEGN